MSEMQQTAIEKPCYFGFETLYPRYSRIVSPFHSIVLTVNSGYE